MTAGNNEHPESVKRALASLKSQPASEQSADRSAPPKGHYIEMARTHAANVAEHGPRHRD